MYAYPEAGVYDDTHNMLLINDHDRADDTINQSRSVNQTYYIFCK